MQRDNPDPSVGAGSSPWLVWAVLAVAAVVFFHGLDVMPFQEPDEGRYAEIAREIAAPGGDGLTPHLNGIRYFEKPPLYFWTLAAVFRLLGPSEASARLVSALSMWLSVALLAWVAWRVLGPRLAALAVAIFCSIPLVLLFSHIVLVDTLLLLWLTGAFAALHVAVLDRARGRPPTRWAIWAFYVCSALATLTKGPIGLAIPGMTVLGYLALTRDGVLFRALARPDGPLLYLLLAAPWFVLMERHNPGYLHAFFVEENFGRLTTGGRFNRQGPLWYYLPVLLGGCFPWSVFALGALVNGWRERARLGLPGEERAVVRLAAAAVLGPLVLLSIANSKLAYYILPLLPPFALWLAWAFGRGLAVRRAERGARWIAAFALLFVIAGLAAIAWGLWGEPGGLARWIVTAPEGGDKRVVQIERAHALYEALVPIGAGVLGLGAAAAIAAAAMRRRGALVGAGWIAAALGVAGLLWPYAAAPFGTFYSHRDVARALAPLLQPGDEVVFYRSFRRTIPFFLGRTVTLWHAAYNEFGHEVEPDAESRGVALQSDRDRLRALLGGPRRVFVVVTGNKRLREIEALSPRPLREVVRIGTKRVLLSAPGGEGGS